MSELDFVEENDIKLIIKLMEAGMESLLGKIATDFPPINDPNINGEIVFGLVIRNKLRARLETSNPK